MSYFLTTKTGFSAVPLDCLLEIFQYLENDMTSLYRCILVNRTWCKINVALLWRRPFEHSGSISTRRYSELIRTYINCLSRKSKIEIYEKGYNIPDDPKVLFQYHQYLKELDCQKLDEAVNEWIVDFGGFPFPEDKDNIVYTKLLYLLLSRGKDLWRLRLGQYKDKYRFPSVSTFPKCSLANLRRFEFLGNMDCLGELEVDNICEFLRKLSNTSNNLEYIDVDMTEDKDLIAGSVLRQLIASKKNLSFFRYHQGNSNVDNSKNFIEALSHNANTLKYIEFEAIPLNNQCLSPLKNFNNLECIRFAFCEDKKIPTDTEEIVENFPSQLNVEKLIFHSGNLESVTLEMLRLVNTSLKELTVGNIIPNLFEYIFKHCPNIKYLSTVISEKNIESLSYLSASKIEHLILKTLDSSENIEIFETKDFQQLGRSLFLHLRHLTLNLNVSVDELSSLLKECQSPLESLCLKFDITTDDDLNKDEYLKVILEFAKRVDSLKEFKFFLNFKNGIEARDNIDIFSKDILTEAKLIIPNILRETQALFTYSKDDHFKNERPNCIYCQRENILN